MSARPTPPPQIAGFRFIESLGSGGFADVYLYEQARPSRRVAVKVLRTGLADENERLAFESEANLMASLSTHPSIVTIYAADIAADGRPFMAMEYCPKPNLAVRLRSGPLPLAEALRIGIQVSGAVETVHRADILHRDIKPANILITEYNRPALSDFGIARALADGSAAAAGFSVPWSPPEAFDPEPSNDIAIDVYALGATVYSLLMGRSPFQLPGLANGNHDLMERIRSAPLQPLNRADAPASLDRILAQSMAKNPRDRFDNALEFGRALQRVQVELSHEITAADVLDESIEGERVEEEDDGNTRIRGIVSIDPMQPRLAPPLRPIDTRLIPAAPIDDATRAAAIGAVPAFDQERTVMRGSAAAFVPPALIAPPVESTQRPASASVAPAPVQRRSRRPILIGGLAVAALAAVGVGAVLFSGLPSSTADPRASVPADAPADPLSGESVPAVTGLTGAAAADGVTFSWTNPDPQPGDLYLWGVVTAGAETNLQTGEDTTVTVPADPSGRTCIEVSIRRDGGRASDESTTGCAP
ncbi:protein kinase [Microbacteriaceae bacterium VKM Ac-2854]|nr:protein kinase [Microbacteriaceae bacterium VKM Ac-2854]